MSSVTLTGNFLATARCLTFSDGGGLSWAFNPNTNTLTASLESTLSTAGNQMVTTANNLLQTGLQAAQISTELPAYMLQLTNTMNASTAQALAGFASAVGKTGQGGQLTLNVNPSSGQVTA